MPSARLAYEKLKWMVEHGRAEEVVHIVLVEQEQKERIANKKRKQNFVLCTGDPDLCAKFEREKDRVYRKVRNKSLMLTLLERAWEEALSDSELDKILAAMEMQED